MDCQSRQEVALTTVLAVFSHHAVNNYYEIVLLQLATREIVVTDSIKNKKFFRFLEPVTKYVAHSKLDSKTDLCMRKMPDLTIFSLTTTLSCLIIYSKYTHSTPTQVTR